MVAPLLELPSEVLSTVLGSFLDGKSISTFLIVVQGCRDCNNIDVDNDTDGDANGNSPVFSLLKGALVHRYGQLRSVLSNCTDQSEDEEEENEMRDVLMVLREDIRTSHDISKFPEWCAILDYFESQMESALAGNGFVMWCGPIETVFGEFQACLRCTTEWTLGALHYWYHDIETQQFSIVHPYSHYPSEEQFDLTNLYGTVEGITEYDQTLLKRLHYNLEDDPGHWQHYLVLQSRSYDEEPTEFFTPKIGEDDEKLLCYWDYTEQTFDWESALERLGENVIRIMSRAMEAKGSFP